MLDSTGASAGWICTDLAELRSFSISEVPISVVMWPPGSNLALDGTWRLANYRQSRTTKGELHDA
jgi:hypothetical protein